MLTRRFFLRITVLGCSLALGLERRQASAEEPTQFPPAARQRYEQGRNLQKQGQLDAAIRAFEEAIQLGMGGYPRVHLQRARSNLDLRKFDLAIAQYTEFIERFGLEESCRY